MSLVEMSLAGGMIVLAAMIVRALGRDRLPVGAFECLWTLAWLRLTLPVRLPFRLSAFALLRQAAGAAAGHGPGHGGPAGRHDSAGTDDACLAAS